MVRPLHRQGSPFSVLLIDMEFAAAAESHIRMYFITLLTRMIFMCWNALQIELILFLCSDIHLRHQATLSCWLFWGCKHNREVEHSSKCQDGSCAVTYWRRLNARAALAGAHPCIMMSA